MSYNPKFPPREPPIVRCNNQRCGSVLGEIDTHGALVITRGGNGRGRTTITQGIVVFTCHWPRCGAITVIDIRK
jgi:hypothetical protein